MRGQGARGSNILEGGPAHPIITQLLFESSIFNPVDSKSYWSIGEFVGFCPPPNNLKYSTSFTMWLALIQYMNIASLYRHAVRVPKGQNKLTDLSMYIG